MNKWIQAALKSPFEEIKHTDLDSGAEFESSRDFAVVLGYVSYQHFEGVIEKAKLAFFNGGHQIEDHFNGTVHMVTIGSGAKRQVKTILMLRYACYLAIQNAYPKKKSCIDRRDTNRSPRANVFHRPNKTART